MKSVAIIAATLLFVAVFNLPIGYYTFMRIGVTIGSILLIRQEIRNDINTWVILFGIITIIFNPILPIYLGSKSSWIPIDTISGIIFLAYVFTNKRNDDK
jgi:hypothetical protein